MKKITREAIEAMESGSVLIGEQDKRETIAIFPNGETDPVRFQFGWTCGGMKEPGVDLTAFARRGGSVLTWSQIRALYKWLGQVIADHDPDKENQ